MTVAQVAAYLQLNRLTVYRYVREGRIPAARIGKLYRILRADVDRFLEARHVEAEPRNPAPVRESPLRTARSGPVRQPRPEEIYVGTHARERPQPWDPETAPDSPVNWILRILH